MNPLRMTKETIRLGGHRGHSTGAPENTLAAFRKAFEYAGPKVTCETDLSITADGELILMHDKTVDRTTNGRGIAQKMTYSEISKLDAGSWFSDEFAGEHVPRLRDALQLARELGIIYQLELKIYDRNDVFFPKLRSLIDELSCADLLQFSSFDYVQLKAVKAAIPEVPTVGLMHSRLIDPAAIARQANLDAMNIEIYHFASGEARQLHEEGFAAFCYLPAGHHEKLMQHGVDVEAQVVQWVREGQLDQLLGDDVTQVARLRDEARG
ncbi:phosphodiesterase (plasmid) [Agrobacterium fabrum]|uniref:glycerophosphodiester phosphodiesterase n=1 Tax=Rhizobium/Agrobacterium group TaxID=227290 RepID=UPI0004D46B43|nr:MULTISPECIES: glycerophosphodiester phosphodiesterase family protein [Rhizobium/Agrobacterium group]KEA04452.1 phosphodiesterase [Rhizobium rhizogenes]NMV72351.1 phosphodiesterase [Agrobacterium fabrum]NTF72650.1 phosphodiesterase [Rhizobium rhizogenes]NTI85363.1 phosphodiesterase [Rhizobium rhizogenes]NTJ27546.1 phosphodiesterase [Rhizobium rhizogenes]